MFCFLYPLAKIKFSFLNICLKSLLSFRMSLEVKVRKFSIHSPESISFIERLDPSQYVLSIMRHGLQFDLKETPPPYFEPNKQQVLYSEPVSMPSCKIGVRTFVLSVPQWVASSNNRWDPSAARIYPAFSFLPGHRHRPRTFNFIQLPVSNMAWGRRWLQCGLTAPLGLAKILHCLRDVSSEAVEFVLNKNFCQSSSFSSHCQSYYIISLFR